MLFSVSARPTFPRQQQERVEGDQIEKEILSLSLAFLSRASDVSRGRLVGLALQQKSPLPIQLFGEKCLFAPQRTQYSEAFFC